jgi:hypothetical protein
MAAVEDADLVAGVGVPHVDPTVRRAGQDELII